MILSLPFSTFPFPFAPFPFPLTLFPSLLPLFPALSPLFPALLPLSPSAYPFSLPSSPFSFPFSPSLPPSSIPSLLPFSFFLHFSPKPNERGGGYRILYNLELRNIEKFKFHYNKQKERSKKIR